MANNYNIMADYIVSKYVERVSGKDLPDIFVEDDPAERVMVGMLAEDRIDTTFQGGYTENSSTKFESVPSISFSFVVKKSAQGVIRIIPRGLFFYMIHPDYDFHDESLVHQVDVLAVDDETIIFVECRAVDEMTDQSFAAEIKEFRERIAGLRKEALKKYPNRKSKFIWATHNYIIQKKDLIALGR